MDKEFKETLSFVSDYISSSVIKSEIKKIKDEMSEYYDNIKFDNKYDGYTIEEILMLYKITRLRELNIVSEETALHLKELLYLRIEIDKEIWKQSITGAVYIFLEKNYISKLPELQKKREIIDTELRKYSLFIDINEITSFIDYSVKNRIYPTEEREKELKETLKLVRK